MPYFPNTDADRQAMLEAIGAASIDDLFAMIPAELRMKRDLCVPPGLGELELSAHLAELAAENTPATQAACFLGGGSYDHFIPAVVDMVAARSEFYTAYTPYQPEASQGSLQAFFEYQTLVTQLTGMDVSNASLYDGGSAAAEAVLMALHATGRNRVVTAESVHPEYRQVLATYLANLGVDLVTLDAPEGTISPAELAAAVNQQTACVLVQHPNFFGCLEEVEQAAEIAHKARGAVRRVGRSDQPWTAKAAGRLRGRYRGGRGPIAGQSDVVRRSVFGHHGLSRAVLASHARPAGRPDGRPPRPALLGVDASNPRAAHPPRKGHQQHLHEPRSVGPPRHGLSCADGSGRHARRGRVVSAKIPLCRRAAVGRAVVVAWRSIGRRSRSLWSA